MAWDESIDAEFPPPREGEPPDLRRNIIDEIADHLHCALRRELLRDSDESSARRAVLARFGNPVQIARRLWWGAMKEKVMKDRILMGGVIVMAAVSIVAMVFAWQAVSQSNEVNAAILARLENLAMTPPVPPAPAIADNWSEVTFHVTEEKSGQPIADARVEFRGAMFNDTEETRLYEQTDDDGRITFGPIRPGEYDYKIDVDKRWLSSCEYKCILYPGRQATIDITCPSSDREAAVKLEVDWPEDLKDKGLLVTYHLVPSQLHAENMSWVPWAVLSRITSDGEVLPSNTHLETVKPSGPAHPRTNPRASNDLLVLRDVLRELYTNAPAEPHFYTTRYALESITIHAPAEDPEIDAGPLYRNIWYYEFSLQAFIGSQPRPAIGRFLPPPIYEAKAVVENEWSLELPEAMIEHVREYLATKSPSEPASQPAASR